MAMTIVHNNTVLHAMTPAHPYSLLQASKSENLLNEAMRVTHTETQTAVIVLALEELIHKARIAGLKGQVSSLFTLEAKIDNRYKPIAYIFYNYDSWVDINHNKDFVHRYFGDLEQKYIEHKNTERDLTKVIANSKKNCPKQLEPNKKFLDDLHYGEELICLNNETGLDEKQQKKLVESAILEYKKAFESIQNRIPCDVTYGKIGKDKKLALVFICEGFDHSQGYTRVMKKFR